MSRPTDLSKVRACLTADVPAGRSDDDTVRRQWWAALSVLQEELLVGPGSERGIWLASPLPALYAPALLNHLQGWVWAPESVEHLLGRPSPLLPAMAGQLPGPGAPFERLSLREQDGSDPLLLVITSAVQVGLCLDGPAAGRRLVVRFEPTVLSQALGLIHQRLAEEAPLQAERLRQELQHLGSLQSDPQLGQRFWPLLADRLAAIAPSVTLQPQPQRPGESTSSAVSGELALLEALTHEVRTPLATIRILIRSLLRRQDLPAVVRQRLEQIDGECSEQIDRFGLIFLAAELQRQPAGGEGGNEGGGNGGGGTELARTDLSVLLQDLAGLWQRQLARRGLNLELVIAPGLPPVLSDPARLETMLGGLMDRFSRGLAAGSTVTLALQPAGSRLKLRLSNSDRGQAETPSRPSTEAQASGERPTRRAVGPVLSWNPTTGSLHLSRQATQQLFRRLGGRLTERGGSDLTVFFPTC